MERPLPDAPHPLSRAFDFAHCIGYPVGAWDEVRVGQVRSLSARGLPDVPTATGVWARVGVKGLHLVAYVDGLEQVQEPAALGEALSAAHRWGRVHCVSVVFRRTRGGCRVTFAEGPLARPDVLAQSVEAAAAAIYWGSGGAAPEPAPAG